VCVWGGEGQGDKGRNEEKKKVCVLQPHFEGSVKMKLTLSKLGLRSPLGLLKLQSSITGVKTPCIGVFFIPLKTIEV